MTNSKCTLSLQCQICLYNQLRKTLFSTAVFSLDVSKEPCRRPTHPRKRFVLIELKTLLKDISNGRKYNLISCYISLPADVRLWLTLHVIIWHFKSGIMLASCAVPEAPSAWSLFGCASWWTVCSPRQRAIFQRFLTALSVAAIIPGLKTTQLQWGWSWTLFWMFAATLLLKKSTAGSSADFPASDHGIEERSRSRRQACGQR